MIHAKNKNLLVITSVFVVVLLLLLIDFRILVFVQQFIPPELKYVGKILSKEGVLLLYGIFLLLFIYALINKNQKLKKTFLVYLQVQILFSFILVRIMKIVFGRARPKIGSESSRKRKALHQMLTLSVFISFEAHCITRP